MRRAGNRILGHSHRWSKEPRYNVVVRPTGTGGHDDASDREQRQSHQIGFQPPHRCFIGQFAQEIVRALPGPKGSLAEPGDQFIRRLDGGRRSRRKIHRDGRAGPFAGQKPAVQRLKSGRLIGPQPSRLPQRMRGRQRRVAAQRHFSSRREPPQFPLVSPRHHEGGLGQIHLGGHTLHPVGPHRAGWKTDRSRIAAKRFGGESVDDTNGCAHSIPTLEACVIGSKAEFGGIGRAPAR